MDKLEFYRVSTTYVARMLDSDQALEELFLYLRQFVPLYGLSWHKYDQDIQYLQYQAVLTENRFQDLHGRIIPTTHAIRSAISTLEDNRFLLVEDSSKNALTASIVVALSDILGPERKSVLLMYLEWQNMPQGLICLYHNDESPWPEDHLKLLRMLDLPFAFATWHMQRYMDLIEQKNKALEEKKYIEGELKRITESKLIGANSGLREVMNLVKLVAKTDTPVLISGETGVGKEMIANAIQRTSSRRECPYVKVNCGAIPHSLINSELFGHEKGSFTGAHQSKKGKFERAEDGTIFLDEIGELPLESQVKLLRVLQNREAERVGGKKTFMVRARFIAATNRNLQQLVASGEFRDDLFFRINVFPIVVPPLRHRKQDIPALVSHLINKKKKEMKIAKTPMISPKGLTDLTEHDWPGNVRELENLVERSLIINPQGPLTFEHLLQPADRNKVNISNKTGNQLLTLNEINQRHIEKALSIAKGKINGPGGAAELLDVYPNTLRRRMDKLGIAYGRKINSG